MIRFDGALTDNAKEYFMNKMINRMTIFAFFAIGSRHWLPCAY